MMSSSMEEGKRRKTIVAAMPNIVLSVLTKADLDIKALSRIASIDWKEIGDVLCTGTSHPHSLFVKKGVTVRLGTVSRNAGE